MASVSATAARMTALGRAEFTLLLRNRTALFTALLMPIGMVWLISTSVAEADLDGTGLSAGGVTMTGGIGAVLILVVYTNLVAAYVARREELVLKRLRTGEPTDPEILAGTALPTAGLALAQCALLVVAGTALLDLTAPRRPELLVAGLALGVVLLSVLAAATAMVTRTVESAQVTVLPLMMVSFLGSGLVVPLELMPDRLADALGVLPFTPVVELVRTGWLGGAAAGGGTVRALLLAAAWTALAGYAVRRWFRWEPRR
ncbi:ABC transporter permease [Streptomyces xinghaiensis]|uniref:ABC transporter permease n=1 Tax=Streptomyces xinghaiensis TaxID=1038928 RepID=UPI003411FD23